MAIGQKAFGRFFSSPSDFAIALPCVNHVLASTCVCVKK